MTSPFFVNSCPEAPSEINVTQTTLEVDGDSVAFYDEVKAYDTPGDLVYVGGVWTIPLAHTPVSQASVLLAYNTGVQVPDTDWSLTDDTISLTFTPEAGDVFLIHYLGS